jgi:hypothetical protein
VLVVLLLLFVLSASLSGCKPKQAVVPPPPELPVVIPEDPIEPEPLEPVLPWSDADVADLLNQDDKDWTRYPDLPLEKAAIAEVLGDFSDAMGRQDVDDAVACVFVDQQESYRILFAGKPEAMPGFGELIAKAEMSFLSEARDPEKTMFLRTAEYKVILSDFTFYIRFLKTPEGWVLYDF